MSLARFSLKKSTMAAGLRRVALARVPRANFGGSSHSNDSQNTADGEFDRDTHNWKLASIGVVPIIGGLSFYGWLYERQEHEEQHHHPFQKPKYTYLRTAVKKWPWQNKECTFWDMDCHKAADLKKKMGGAAH